MNANDPKRPKRAEVKSGKVTAAYLRSPVAEDILRLLSLISIFTDGDVVCWMLEEGKRNRIVKKAVAKDDLLPRD